MNAYAQQRARLRALLGKPPRSGASSLAPSAPPVVLGPTTGGASNCKGCEDGCGGCVQFGKTVCDRCGTVGADQSWEGENGERLLDLHLACVPDGPWPITTRVAKALAQNHDLVFATRDLRWRMVEEAS